MGLALLADNFDIRGISIFLNDLECSMSNVAIYCKKITETRPKIFFFLNEQRSKDAAAKKRPNTSGVGKFNHYYEDVYIPPYNNTD